jgi:hypothetical protein
MKPNNETDPETLRKLEAIGRALHKKRVANRLRREADEARRFTEIRKQMLARQKEWYAQ